MDSIPAPVRLPFDWEPLFRRVARLAAITPASAWVEVGEGRVVARFGPWTVETPLDNISGAEITGPYSLTKVLGPARLSLVDRGITFASNRRTGLCLEFREPVTGLDPIGRLRHPGLTVTVDGPARLLGALGAAGASVGAPPSP